MSIDHGWRALATPTYAVSRFGRAVEFPAGTEIRLSPVIDASRLGDDTVAVRAGFPFECEAAPRSHQSAIWFVTASALRLPQSSRPFTLPLPDDAEIDAWMTERGAALVSAGPADGPYSLMGRGVL